MKGVAGPGRHGGCPGSQAGEIPGAACHCIPSVLPRPQPAVTAERSRAGQERESVDAADGLDRGSHPRRPWGSDRAQMSLRREYRARAFLFEQFREQYFEFGRA